MSKLITASSKERKGTSARDGVVQRLSERALSSFLVISGGSSMLVVHVCHRHPHRRSCVLATLCASLPLSAIFSLTVCLSTYPYVYRSLFISLSLSFSLSLARSCSRSLSRAHSLTHSHWGLPVARSQRCFATSIVAQMSLTVSGLFLIGSWQVHVHAA